MIHVYTGDGKGKTTAAFGLAVRAAGQGLSVRAIQFLKGSRESGEVVSARRLGLEVFSFGKRCSRSPFGGWEGECISCGECWLINDQPSGLDREEFSRGWQLARETVQEREFHLLVLDEIITALNKNLIEPGEFLQWMDNIPGKQELVLTGRNAPPGVIEKAHLVSRIENVKHYFQEGLEARQGIEF